MNHWLEFLSKEQQLELMRDVFIKLDENLKEYGYRCIESARLEKLEKTQSEYNKIQNEKSKNTTSPQQITIHGHTFKSMAKAAKFFNVKPQMLYNAKAAGKEFEDVIEKPEKTLKTSNIYKINDDGSVEVKRRDQA